ncbi:MAG TPA: hypothetical protein VLJ11_06515, partial [Bryobacteraceae bacterium]|nr:hypothetical protein [Bryobacteraceae bacterium]
TSVADLRRKLMKYIPAYTNSARPIRWTYTDPKHHIRAKSITGTALWSPCRTSGFLYAAPPLEIKSGAEFPLVSRRRAVGRTPGPQ